MSLRNGAAMGFEVRAVVCSRTGVDARGQPRARLDEMAVTIAGRQFWLWRAVDDKGEVLSTPPRGAELRR
jgi:transposase-like protein